MPWLAAAAAFADPGPRTEVTLGYGFGGATLALRSSGLGPLVDDVSASSTLSAGSVAVRAGLGVDLRPTAADSFSAVLTPEIGWRQVVLYDGGTLGVPGGLLALDLCRWGERRRVATAVHVAGGLGWALETARPWPEAVASVGIGFR